MIFTSPYLEPQQGFVVFTLLYDENAELGI
jgi:hypothetical protein